MIDNKKVVCVCAFIRYMTLHAEQAIVGAMCCLI